MKKGKKKLRIRAGAIYMHELDGMTFGGVIDYLTSYGDTIEE